MTALPVSEHLEKIASALQQHNAVILQAAPGAGKTMLVPPLFRSLTVDGRTILVEPRRIAARAAAAGIAAIHKFTLGKECGFAVRGDSCMPDKNGILAVTPGVWLQMLQRDPELTGVSGVIFDEFHERSLEMDLAFTLTLDIRSALREDLKLGIMSATMDSTLISSLVHAPAIQCPGRTFPVEVTYRPGITDPREIAADTARAVLENLNVSAGNILVFLPGADEIERCCRMLQSALPPGFALARLHGALPFEEQKRVLRPEDGNIRKIILSTNVAESSLTIPGVRCVIDSGWEKIPVYHPESGMTFLETRRITLDSAIQRSGRAGRIAPGKAVRCWDKFQESSFAAHIRPEILSAELSQLALTLANWMATPEQLNFPDPPPQAAYRQALTTLRSLGFMDADNHLTPDGKRAADSPVQLRQAALMLRAPANMRTTAAKLAAILEEKDDLRTCGADLRDRLARWNEHKSGFRIQKHVCDRLLKMFPPETPLPDAIADCGRLIAAAFPEWIGAARTRHGTLFQLAGGRAARLRDDDPLRGAEFLAIARLDVSGSSGDAVIRLAVPVDKAVIEELFADEITTSVVTAFDGSTDSFSAREVRCFRELVLASRPCPVPENGCTAALINEALRRNIQLPPPEAKAATALLHRVRFARSHGLPELPDWSNEALPQLLLEHAAPLLPRISNFAALKKADWFTVLSSMLTYQMRQQLDRFCPAHFRAPSGREFAIDYSGGEPSLSMPVQQLYGVDTHPCAGTDRFPLKLVLLSPAMRPVQITSDLPGFWRGSWQLVAKEMRARYPKHPWPENPV